MDDSALAEIFDEPGEMEEIRGRAALRAAGLRLGEIRKRLGLPRKMVAERMGVSQKRVSAIETATLVGIRLSTLAAYAEALGGRLDVSIDVADRHSRIALDRTPDPPQPPHHFLEAERDHALRKARELLVEHTARYGEFTDEELAEAQAAWRGYQEPRRMTKCPAFVLDAPGVG